MNQKKNNKNQKLDKRTYHQPEIRKVRMVVDEALAPGCKTPAAMGPTVGTPCLAPQCFSPGS